MVTRWIEFRFCCVVASLWLAAADGRAKAADAAGAKEATDAKAQTAKVDATRESAIVYVGPSLGWAVYDGHETRSPSLTRELSRQALLIAAREELGLATRDSWLASETPTAGDNGPFELVGVTGLQGEGALDVLRGPGGQQEVVLRLPFPTPHVEAHLPEFLVRMEAASRTDFVESLKKSGFTALTRPARRAAPEGQAQSSERIERWLAELNEYAQFAALREIHDRLRNEGESPRLSGQLVRGYAQLGALTETCWAPMNKCFKARALLYAQRMVMKYPGPGALEHLAFAEALSGLPGAALENLAKAHAADQAAPPNENAADRPASWRRLLDAYCHLNTDELEKLSEDPSLGSLPGLLRFMAFEQAGCVDMTMQNGAKLLESLPDCARVYAAPEITRALGVGNMITTAAPASFARNFRPGLLGVPGLPSSAKTALDNLPAEDADGGRQPNFWKAEAAVLTALLGCGKLAPRGTNVRDAALNDAGEKPDDNELRWETLGLVLREVSWQQVCRRARFIQSMLGGSCDGWLDETRDFTSIHPHDAFLQTYRSERDVKLKFLALAAAQKAPGLELPGNWMGVQMRTLDVDKGDEFIEFAFRTCDDTAFELSHKMTLNHYAADLNRWGKALLAVSPHSPLAQARLVANQYDQVREQAAAWEPRAEMHPLLGMAFGKHYAVSDPDRAEKYLRSAAKMSHDLAAYLALADIYNRQGLDGRWLATMESYLKKPSPGLEHVQVKVLIANHFSDKGAWAEAKPYADDAAESYAAFGLYAAAYVHEALREWPEAERYYRAVSTRYDAEGFAWYKFCRRTGKGDAAAARQVAEAFVRAGGAPVGQLATYYQLEKQSEPALTATASAGRSERHPFFAMDLAMLAEREKQFDQRDSALRRISPVVKKEDQPKANAGAELVELAKILLADLKAGGKAEFDVADVEKRCATVSQRGTCNFHYFFGSYLDDHGKTDLAIEQWKKCQACPVVVFDPRTHAGALLIEHGIHPEDYENPLLKPKPAAQ